MRCTTQGQPPAGFAHHGGGQLNPPHGMPHNPGGIGPAGGINRGAPPGVGDSGGMPYRPQAGGMPMRGYGNMGMAGGAHGMNNAHGVGNHMSGGPSHSHTHTHPPAVPLLHSFRPGGVSGWDSQPARGERSTGAVRSV